MTEPCYAPGACVRHVNTNPTTPLNGLHRLNYVLNLSKFDTEKLIGAVVVCVVFLKFFQNNIFLKLKVLSFKSWELTLWMFFFFLTEPRVAYW